MAIKPKVTKPKIKKKRLWRPPKISPKVIRKEERREKMNEMIDKLFFWEKLPDWSIKAYSNLSELLKYSWISKQMFSYYLKEDEALRVRYNTLREVIWMSNTMSAENNLSNALEWTWDFEWLEAKERAKLSLDYLKSVDVMYNPKINVETKNVNLDVSMEDLYRQFEQFKNM